MARWTDEFRATAILLLEYEGYPERKGALTRISKSLKVPMGTLSRWVNRKSNPPPSEIVSIKKEEILRMLKGEVYAALKEMTTVRQDADYKELATTIGIFVDKMQLLDGEPTERHEVIHELSDDERANRIASLLERSRARRDGRASDNELIQ